MPTCSKSLAFIVLFMALLGVPALAWAQPATPRSYGFTHQGIHRTIRPAPRQAINPLPSNLPLYNPYFSNNFGPLYEPYEEPCYYDEYYGYWVGPCTTSLDTPGYSITVPNRVR